MNSLHLIADATSQQFPGLELWGPAALLLVALGFVGRWLMARYDKLVDKFINEVIPALTEAVSIFKAVLDALKALTEAERLRAERDEWRTRATRAETLVEALQAELRRRP